MDLNLDLLTYYLTSINQYSFGLLILLFALSFLINKTVKNIIFIRVLLGFLIIVFYLIGWKALEYGNQMLGRTIPYNTELIRVCPIKKINELVDGNFYHQEIAQKYKCALEKASNTFFKYSDESKLLTKNKIITSFVVEKDFKVIGSIRIYPVGLLSNSFGNEYILLIIKDNKNNIYIASESILEGNVK